MKLALASYSECINFIFVTSYNFIKSYCCVNADFHCTLHSFDKNYSNRRYHGRRPTTGKGTGSVNLDYTVAICIRCRAM